MADVTICAIHCECEQGTMFKTAMKDKDGKPALFALVRGNDEDFVHYNAIVFQGYCSHCGRRFEFSLWVENLLDYKEVG